MQTTSENNAGYPASPFQVGDRVMFARRCQTTTAGMPVEAVDITMFDVRLRVNGQWWVPECFMPFEQWRRQQLTH